MKKNINPKLNEKRVFINQKETAKKNTLAYFFAIFFKPPFCLEPTMNRKHRLNKLMDTRNNVPIVS